MPLSEYEQRMLEQMERQLRSDDPKLADTLGSRRAVGSRVLLGSLLLIGGIGLLLGGVVTQLPWLGVTGFLAMFGGVWLAVSAPRRAAPKVAAGGKPPGPRPVPHRSFMQRMEDRWDKRRGGR
jgi:hypothetical protein